MIDLNDAILFVHENTYEIDKNFVLANLGEQVLIWKIKGTAAQKVSPNNTV